MKECFKCGQVKPLSDFYKHKQMADGHVNKCKECNKQDVRENRSANADYYRQYDKERGNRQSYDYVADYRSKNKNKHKAHGIVQRAVRGMKLFKEPCEVCGQSSLVHAHHDDYLKPLNVRWLCPAHHKQWHDENGEGLNGS